MRNLTQFINESKSKPLYDDCSIRYYINVMIDTWMNRMQNKGTVMLRGTEYDKLDLVRQAEIMVTILEHIADIVHLHFIDAADEEAKKKYEFYTAENGFYRAFNTIENIANIKVNYGDKTSVDLESELKELRQRMEDLVSSSNKKYAEYVKAQKCPCKSDKCDCGCDCCVPCSTISCNSTIGGELKSY